MSREHMSALLSAVETSIIVMGVLITGLLSGLLIVALL